MKDLAILFNNHCHKGRINIFAKSKSRYIQDAVRMYGEYIAKHLSKGYRWLKRAKSTFAIGYCSILDVSSVFDQIWHLINSS